MDLEEVKAILSSQKEILAERFKVKEISVFGSYVRGEGELGDIDILVEFGEPEGWEFVDILKYLEDVLGRKGAEAAIQGKDNERGSLYMRDRPQEYHLPRVFRHRPLHNMEDRYGESARNQAIARGFDQRH